MVAKIENIFLNLRRGGREEKCGESGVRMSEGAFEVIKEIEQSNSWSA